ncbi:nucleoside hydrolase-like domain-containing protein [Paratractidigestivibacter sp.]|uniref:nucleoside hydrolase-like domain-containing protein n=1 Tax=Paratractidigestivibacter sp. TaxID=2847316 RepID=UPI002AC96602|nr:nucleoside hydrolase-like domain-containing protein [Paratractidigestivibacter sp.]
MEKHRVIITTDMEIDDMNSVVHLALYLNLLDVEAVVYTSSQYHFLGDGAHTLGEVTSHWRTKGRRSCEWEVVPSEPDPEAGSLTSYRPWPVHWLEELWTGDYAEAWPYLCANAAAAGEPAFPSPDELLAKTYVGNVAFEGDVRADTPGSDVIRAAILDDDPRELWLLSWGGANTIVRALMSIADEYAGGPEWDAVRESVYRKVRVAGIVDGVGQDNSWADNGRELFGGLRLMRVPFVYGGYVDAKLGQPDTLPLFRAPWPQANLVCGNGPLMARYALYGDGRVYEGECDRFQFGRHARLDWGLAGAPAFQFDRGDFMAEGDSMTYIPLLPFGLRGADEDGFDTLLGPMYLDGEKPPVEFAPFTAPETNINPYLRAYQEDFAARAQWCANAPDACNHAPVIAEVSPDTAAVPGEPVALHAVVSDPDGDVVTCVWRRYGATGEVLWEAAGADAEFTVPADAMAGERIVLTLVARDEAERPMTRYAQLAVTCR